MNLQQLGGRFAALLVIAAIGVAEQSDAAVFRYRLSGDWQDVTDGASNGWGLNPNNDGVTPGPGLPGASDDARINFGANTVTVTSSVPTVNRVQIGVDESGIVEVNSGGVLSTATDLLAGNNNANANGTLIVNDGGIVNIGRIFWTANNDSDGIVDIRSGGVVNVESHLWWGVSGTSDIDISGTVQQNGGILGLGTNNASDATGGTAIVDILDGGLLALNNISGADGLPSVQDGSLINIELGGELTLPGDFAGLLADYATAGKLAGLGVPGLSNLAIDLTSNPGFTTVSAVPEPTTLLMAGAVLSLLASARRR